MYADKTIRCRDCGMDFVFSAGEQEFYASKGLVNEPQRCQSCRVVAKQNRALGIAGEPGNGNGNGNGNGGQREMHAAVCAECGGQALVPFLPRNDRPVYCSNCFDKVRARA
ncbi:zinc-ribbon domain containing protein [soil metagenome]